jgi:peptide chain release factor subunit 3
MIGGATQADVAILVISAKSGEFESGFNKNGQTCEHAMLVKTLGVSHLIVVINKMDEETVKWSNERYEKITTELLTYLKKKVGYSEKNITFVPISAYSNINIDKKLTKEDCDWYT